MGGALVAPGVGHGFQAFSVDRIKGRDICAYVYHISINICVHICLHTYTCSFIYIFIVKDKTYSKFIPQLKRRASKF